jgi:hypothetical protein
VSYVACTKRAEHRPPKCQRHTRSRVCPLIHDTQMTVDTHPAAVTTEDDVNEHMVVDAPFKENASKFAAGGLILPPPDIKCAFRCFSLHQNILF